MSDSLIPPKVIPPKVPIRLYGWLPALILISSSAFGQQLNVRTARAPFFVGTPFALEVEAIDFVSQPKIEIDQSDQPSLDLLFRSTGKSESTQIFQSGGKLVRNRVVKTTFYYQLRFDKPGSYRLGPFHTMVKGKKISFPEIKFEVKDIEVTKDMKVEIGLPNSSLYPGQKVPVQLKWYYSGDLRQVRGLTIRSPIFDQFRFEDRPVRERTDSIPITTAKGVQNFPAEFTRRNIEGKAWLIGTVERTMIPEKPGVFSFPETFVSFQRIVGARRSSDPFGSLFDVQAETIPQRGNGTPVRFEVKPFPRQNQPSSFQGAVGTEFQLMTSLNRTEIRTGDPLTLQINVEGTGNIESIGVPRLKNSLSRADFDWPDGDIAGVTSQSQKQFRVLLRVKNETVTEIPALEFSWFDPIQEEYRTIRSKPIKVSVSKGDVVSTTDVIRADRTGDQGSDWSVDTSNQLDLSIQTDPAKLIYQGTRSNRALWLLYAAGILVLGMPLLLKRIREKPDGDQKRARQSFHRACRRLVETTQSGIELDQLAGELRTLQACLPESIESGLKEELDRMIERCDTILYRPGSVLEEERNGLRRESGDLARRLKDHG